MRASESDVLIAPGPGGGTPDHWYMRWAAKLSTARRVEQRDFDAPVLDEWVDNIERAAAAAARPVILVGHDLGAVAAVHAARRIRNVAAAFLVAPPSEAALRATPRIDRAFTHVPRARLDFPALLVASRNDPRCDYEDAAAYAAAWGATLADAGQSGHIDPESGHGPWPEGLMRLARFLAPIEA